MTADKKPSIKFQLEEMISNFGHTMKEVFQIEINTDLMKEIMVKFDLEKREEILKMDITQLEGEYASQFADLLRETLSCHLLLTRAVAVRKELQNAKQRHSDRFH